MKQLSRLFFGVLAVLLMISSVRSQTFEGTIAMEIIMHQNNEQIIPVTISSKGTNTLMEMEMPQVGSVKMFYDHKAGKITSVMEAMNMGMEMDMKQVEGMNKEKEAPKPVIEATGQKKVINTYNCELYTVKTAKGESNMWLTGDLPKSMNSAMKAAFTNGIGGMSRRPGASSANPYMEEIFKKGLLPIQIETMKDGKASSTITFVKYEQKNLEDSLFVIPSGIKIQKMGLPGGKPPVPSPEGGR